MKHVTSYSEYIAELETNVAILDRLLYSAEATPYPYLVLRLRRYSLGRRLADILSYCIHYQQDEDKKRFVSYDGEYGRGYEVPCSYSYMRSIDGSSKEVWWRNVNFLCVLGLIYRHKPDTDGNRNTPAQEWSVRNADLKTLHAADQGACFDFKPDSWYSFPRYSDGVLREAERRAEILNRVGTSKANKDLVRDMLGEYVANVAFGNGFQISDRTQKQRRLLYDALSRAIDDKGYCYPDELIAEAARMGNYGRRQVEETYSYYRNILLPELGCIYRPVGKPDRDKPGITGKRWIITPGQK